MHIHLQARITDCNDDATANSHNLHSLYSQFMRSFDLVDKYRAASTKLLAFGDLAASKETEIVCR